MYNPGLTGRITFSSSTIGQIWHLSKEKSVTEKRRSWETWSIRILWSTSEILKQTTNCTSSWNTVKMATWQPISRHSATGTPWRSREFGTSLCLLSRHSITCARKMFCIEILSRRTSSCANTIWSRSGILGSRGDLSTPCSNEGPMSARMATCRRRSLTDRTIAWRVTFTPLDAFCTICAPSRLPPW